MAKFDKNFITHQIESKMELDHETVGRATFSNQVNSPQLKGVLKPSRPSSPKTNKKKKINFENVRLLSNEEINVLCENFSLGADEVKNIRSEF